MAEKNTFYQLSTSSQNWMRHYNELVEFVKVHGRYPSRHHIEEHRLLNWLKYQRKVMKGEGADERKKQLIMDVEQLRNEEKREKRGDG